MRKADSVGCRICLLYTSVSAGAGEKFYVRFTRAQRYMHAVLFTTFLGLAATGLPMRFSESFWARRFATGVGGFGSILFLHKFFAVVLTIAFLIHLKDIFQRAFINREKGIFWGPTSMVANWKDVKDIIGHMRWFLGLGPKPKFDRYAYWEKFDYWAVFWGMIVIGFSGYAMWFAPVSYTHLCKSNRSANRQRICRTASPGRVSMVFVSGSATVPLSLIHI